MIRENPDFREILSFDEEITLKVNREFLKDCFYHKDYASFSEKAHIRVLKAEAEIALFKIQHVISVLNRLEEKLL